MKKKGLLIVFEGIDYSGKNHQIHELERNLEAFNKYQGVLRTQEPWESEEIKEKLERDRDVYSDSENIAELFIDDRARHTQKLIRPNLDAGVVVLCSRYKMSTCSYQWTQGVELSGLIEMHNHRGILNPDLTFLLDITRAESEKRAEKSGRKKEKFEKDGQFVNKLISAYNSLTFMSEVDERIFGKVIRINGNREPGLVSEDIWSEFLKVYKKE
jgi:dTMP kinase